MLYNRVISIIVYFKFFLILSFLLLYFYIFVLGGNYLLLYRVYLARVGREEWSLWNSFTKEGALALIYL